MKAVPSLTAAALAATMLTVVPARADDALIRLGVGIVGGIIGEAVRNKNNRRDGELIGRSNRGRTQQAQARSGSRQQSRQQAAPARRAGPAVAALPAAGPIPMFRAELEELETIAVAETAPAYSLDQEAELERASQDFAQIGLFDDEGRYYGEVDGASITRIAMVADLGMSRADAIRVLTGRTSPITGA